MNSALHLKIQRSGWNKAAPYYDNLWQSQLKSVQEAFLNAIDVKRSENVLDIACGSGLVTFPMAQAVGPDTMITATDISEEMLEIARQRAGNQGLNNISFLPMNAEQLTFQKEVFDVAICALGLMYLTDPPLAVREMYRILKPGGRAAALVWGARKNCGWAEVFPIVDRRVTSEVCPLFFQQGTGSTLLHSFEKAGFTQLEEKRLSTYIHHDTASDAGNAMFIGGPVALAWKHFDEQTRQTVTNEYLNTLKAYKNGHGYDVPGEFVFVTGNKA